MLSSLSPVIHWQDLGLHDLQTPREGEGGKAVSDEQITAEATPAGELRRQILSQCVAKNEREWWAASAIERLEFELNAANQRIKRLEEAGDALKAAGYFGGFNDAVDKWIKVKEAKP